MRRTDKQNKMGRRPIFDELEIENIDSVFLKIGKKFEKKAFEYENLLRRRERTEWVELFQQTLAREVDENSDVMRIETTTEDGEEKRKVVFDTKDQGKAFNNLVRVIWCQTRKKIEWTHQDRVFPMGRGKIVIKIKTDNKRVSVKIKEIVPTPAPRATTHNNRQSNNIVEVNGSEGSAEMDGGGGGGASSSGGGGDSNNSKVDAHGRSNDDSGGNREDTNGGGSSSNSRVDAHNDSSSSRRAHGDSGAGERRSSTSSSSRVDDREGGHGGASDDTSRGERDFTLLILFFF